MPINATNLQRPEPVNSHAPGNNLQREESECSKNVQVGKAGAYKVTQEDSVISRQGESGSEFRNQKAGGDGPRSLTAYDVAYDFWKSNGRDVPQSLKDDEKIQLLTDYNKIQSLDEDDPNRDEVRKIADRHNIYPSEGESVLGVACRNGNIAVIEELLEFDKRLAGKLRDVAGDRPKKTHLMIAVETEREDIVRLLLRSGELVKDEASLCGTTSLHLAAKNGLPGIVQLLVDASKGLNALDKEGNTVLMVAAGAGCVSVVDILIRKEEIKAAVNTKNTAGETALSMSIRGKHLEVFEKLLKGTSIDEENLQDAYRLARSGGGKLKKKMLSELADCFEYRYGRSIKLTL